MKKHVKLIASALVLSLVFALCSCDAGTKETTTETTETTTTTVETTTETTEEPTTTTTLPPAKNYDFAETIKVMAECIGKDPESSKKAFEDFFGNKIDDVEPSKAYDEHLMYYYEVYIEIDGVPYNYLILDMSTDAKTVIDLSLSSNIEGSDAVKKAFEDYCKKAESLYGKPIEEYRNETANVVNYEISKKVGLSIADYFSDSDDGFSFGTYSK